MTLYRRSKPLSQLEASFLREKVRQLIKDKSFSEGAYVLTSGKASNYYLDLKPTLFSPDGANGVAELALNELENTWVDHVGGLATGAIPLVSAIVMLSYQFGSPVPGFFVREQPKGHGTKKLIEGLAEGESLQGKRVIIVDDVTTYGGSAMKAIDAVRKAGAEVILALSVVDREEGAEDLFRQQAVPFKWLFRASDFKSQAA